MKCTGNFPAGILLPCSGDLRCIPAGTVPYSLTWEVGINLELYGNRSLTFTGEKSTWCSVKSISNTTHPYTIQSTITLYGSALGPLYLCLKEPTGHMSDNIQEKLFNARNIVVTCSKSGKLTSSLVTYWRDHCLIPNLPSRTLLLVDSFPSHATSVPM